MNMFEQASRIKLRFDSNRGYLTVEDLWDLPLKAPAPVAAPQAAHRTSSRPSLDALAIALHIQLKGTSDVVSFVDPTANAGNGELQLAFDIVKHIIDVKVAERDKAKQEAERKEKKQRILELIASKEDQVLGEKPIEELRALAESL